MRPGVATECAGCYGRWPASALSTRSRRTVTHPRDVERCVGLEQLQELHDLAQRLAADLCVWSGSGGRRAQVRASGTRTRERQLWKESKEAACARMWCAESVRGR